MEINGGSNNLTFVGFGETEIRGRFQDLMREDVGLGEERGEKRSYSVHRN